MLAHDPATPWARPPRWVTFWAPVVISFLVQVPPALVMLGGGDVHDRRAGIALVDPPPAEALLTLALAVIGPLLLLGARRFPGPVVALASAAAALDLLVGDNGAPPYMALAFAIVGAVVRGARVWAWVSIAVSWVATLSLAIGFGFQHWTPGRIAATTLGILVVFGLGEVFRARRERAAEFLRRERENRQREVRAERVRIARELHDVLAHSLSQINVQAGVGLHLMDRQPDKAAEALASIKETSKSALDEVRAVLGVLRAEGAIEPSAPLVPEPDLDRLPGLVASVSAHGLPVQLVDRLEHAAIPKPVQLALYRIAQESLTNAQRHAVEASRIDVTLEREEGLLRLEVSDDGLTPIAPASESGGRGLLGMRERAELLSGRLSAGPAPGRGFRVVAEIPLSAAPVAVSPEEP